MRLTDDESGPVASLAQARASWLFPSLARYRAGWLRFDVVAGLTVWAVLVPEALAYGSLAGVSPVVGLYAAPGALLLYAALGSSRHLVAGPMSATAALSAATVAEFATRGSGDFVTLTAALAICVGIVALVAGALRLGFLASFISEPTLKGFTVGLALTIIIGQVPKLLGIPGGSGNFFERLWKIVTQLGHTHLLTLAVGASSLMLLLALRRFAPLVPGSLVAVLLGIGAVHGFGLDHHHVEVVGQIDAGLPSVGVPHVSLGALGDLLAGAIGIMLVGFADGLSAAKTYADRDHYELDANRELLGLGGANVAAGLCGGMVVNGSLSKTAVNGGAGARTQLSGLIVAVMTVITLLVLTGLFERLPEATLAAVVVAAVIELVDIGALAALYRVYTPRLGAIYGHAARPDFVAAIAALLGVLVFDTLPGLFIGISASLLLLLYRTSRPYVALLGERTGEPGRFVDLARAADAVADPQVPVLRVESALFFANADWVRTHVLARVQPGVTRTVVLDAEAISSLDVTAARMLTGLDEEVTRRGARLLVAGAVGQARDMLSGPDGMPIVACAGSVAAAVAAAALPGGAAGPVAMEVPHDARP